MRLELAADYLVMAAWLAYLKSRLLLPEAPGPEGMSAADMATALAQRLRRLEAIRIAATKAVRAPAASAATCSTAATRKRSRRSSGRNGRRRCTIFSRPMRASARNRRWRMCAFAKRTVWSLVEAREALERMIGATDDWARLDQFLIAYVVDPKMRATAMASSLAATLELVREGQIELHQHAAFAPIYLRKRGADGNSRTVQSRPPANRHNNNNRRITMEPGGLEMASLAEKRVIMSERRNRNRRDHRRRRSARKNCGRSKRCCSPPASRSTRRRWRSVCRRASTCAPRCGGCRPNTRRVASISCMSAPSGRSAPPTILP